MQLLPDLSLVLASQSPRRAYLLEQAGIPFVVRTADTEEVYPPETPVLEVAPYLAELKAEGARHLLQHDDEVLLTADSVVILDSLIYGKPADRDEAISTLRRLAGRTHTVVTGCCLLDARRKEVFSGISYVTFNDMTDAEITWYVDHCQPYDKAGAYAIQEWVGLAKISRIEGTYPNIMGLPVDLVYERLLKWK
ncbi:Maf family protein [Neolewinella lacunae]|uniref:dTTP/UTP pyrophosphatase n=1 Tax=Neolewinella lacunae TaxID=1517758 RepID=A0A923PRC0_9BACT|nr:Maf family protein [Neolewinella lacunae]MBC6995317.1 septum formation protein Maf [Neolewinella lacunae]MDN3633029.1 Maf family protein [Neolewinella lacunae]